MLAQVTHILGLTQVRRTRMLPVAGRVFAQVGQRVNASDVVAEAELSTGHMLLDIRRSLKIERSDEVQETIIRHEGERVSAGDVIAETGGLFSRILRAPASGKVVMISAGRVLLEVETRRIQVQAGISGVVVDMYPERGVAIENHGALVQGAWGNGHIGEGLMVTLVNNPNDELTRGVLEVSLRGAVVIGGMCSDAEVLRISNELPLRGLVLSSMSSELIGLASSLEMPIMVLEGFGKVPMNEAAFKLLSTSEKRDVAINTNYNLNAGDRPELFIPLPTVGQSPPEMTYFAPNQTVRIQGDPYRGKIGVITQVRAGLTVLPNGVRAPTADVRLEKETQVNIPLANLEVIE